MRAALMAFALGVWQATDQAAVFRDCVFNTLRGKGYTDEQIADLFGIGRGQLADQKALRQQLSAYRLASLPVTLQRDIFAAYLRVLGVTVIDDAQLGEYLSHQLARFRKARSLTMALATAPTRKEIA